MRNNLNYCDFEEIPLSLYIYERALVGRLARYSLSLQRTLTSILRALRNGAKNGKNCRKKLKRNEEKQETKSDEKKRNVTKRN